MKDLAGSTGRVSELMEHLESARATDERVRVRDSDIEFDNVTSKLF